MVREACRCEQWIVCLVHAVGLMPLRSFVFGVRCILKGRTEVWEEKRKEKDSEFGCKILICFKLQDIRDLPAQHERHLLQRLV